MPNIIKIIFLNNYLFRYQQYIVWPTIGGWLTIEVITLSSGYKDKWIIHLIIYDEFPVEALIKISIRVEMIRVVL